MPVNRKAPSQPRKIDDIDPRNDIRVRIFGTVLDIAEDSIMIDDGSGTAEVFLDQDHIDRIEENKQIRIIGRVLPTPDSFEIQGEIVQTLDESEVELYNKVKDIVPNV
jgi:uncharacterized protein YdeI (BOF family)